MSCIMSLRSYVHTNVYIYICVCMSNGGNKDGQTKTNIIYMLGKILSYVWIPAPHLIPVHLGLPHKVLEAPAKGPSWEAPGF